MAFMSGTLESLLLYGVSRQSQDGEPAPTDCRKPGNQPRNVTYTGAQQQGGELTMVQSESGTKSRMAVGTHTHNHILSESPMYSDKTRMARLPMRTHTQTRPVATHTSTQAETSMFSNKNRRAVATHTSTQVETPMFTNKTRMAAGPHTRTQTETPMFSNKTRMAAGSHTSSQVETPMFSNKTRMAAGSHTSTQAETPMFSNKTRRAVGTHSRPELLSMFSNNSLTAARMCSQAEPAAYSSSHYLQESDSCGADSDNTSDLISNKCGSDVDRADNKKARSSIGGRREMMRSAREEASWDQLGCLDPDPELQDWSLASTDLTSPDLGGLETLDSGNSNMSLMGCSSVNSETLTQDLYPGAAAAAAAAPQGTQSFLRATEEASRSGQGTSDAHLLPSSQPAVGEPAFPRRNLAQSRRDLSPLYQPQSRRDVNPPSTSRHRMLSEQCFQAAISEGFGSSGQSYAQKVRPMKRFSYHVHNRLTGTNKHVGMEHPHKPHQWDQSLPQSPSETSDILKMALSDTVSTVTSGVAPSSSGFHESQDGSSSDTSSQTSRKDGFGRKYRYNHTALALQQSGLMKTTIKTAEILHRGKILQAELNKLRKETALFMRSVLSNPENQHFRELYLKLHHNKLMN